MNIDPIEANLYQLYGLVAERGHFPVKEAGPFRSITAAGTPWPDMNFIPGLPSGLPGADIGLLAGQIRQEGWSKITILNQAVLTPVAQADLRTNGFLPATQWTNMELDLANAGEWEDKAVRAADDTRVTEVTTADELTGWLEVVEKVLFNGKPLEKDMFLSGIADNIFKLLSVYYKGRVASTGLIFLGRTPGVYMVATDPGYRRLGLAGRLMERARQTALDAGYEKLVLHSTREGLDFYLSLGFTGKGKMTLYYLRK